MKSVIVGVTLSPPSKGSTVHDTFPIGVYDVIIGQYDTYSSQLGNTILNNTILDMTPKWQNLPYKEGKRPVIMSLIAMIKSAETSS